MRCLNGSLVGVVDTCRSTSLAHRQNVKALAMFRYQLQKNQPRVIPLSPNALPLHINLHLSTLQMGLGRDPRTCDDGYS